MNSYIELFLNDEGLFMICYCWWHVMMNIALNRCALKWTCQLGFRAPLPLRGRRGTRCTPQDGSPINAGRLAVDFDYVPAMFTSHRACRKSSQNVRPRSKECRTLLWPAEVWWAHHRFDSVSGKNHQSLVELDESEATYSQTTYPTYIHT